MISWFAKYLRKISGDEALACKFSAEALYELRSERIAQAVSNTRLMSLSNILFASIICWWFWGRGADLALGIWSLSFITTNALAFYKFSMRDPARKVSGSKRAYRAIIKQAFILATFYGLAPFFLIPVAVGSDAAIIAGMAATALVVGPYIVYSVPQASLIWIFTACTLNSISFFGSMQGGFIISGLLGFVIAVGVASATLTQSERITEQFGARQKLREKQDVISLLLREHEDNSSAWVWECDGDGIMTRVPPQLKDLLFGRDAWEHNEFSIFELAERDISDTQTDLSDVIARHIRNKKAFHDLQFEIWSADAAKADNPSRWISVRGKPHLDIHGDLIGFRGIVSDVTESKIAEDKIRFMAGHDPLTKLANRMTFGEGLQPWIDNEKPFASLHLDLDRFKLVNDTMGHPAGDELLVAVAERLQVLAANTSSEAIVARIGGDEFVIAMPLEAPDANEGIDTSAVDRLADSIVKSLSKPFSLAAGTANIGASVGYVVFPEDCADATTMPACADLALYRAKATGRGKFARYTPDMDKRAHDRRLLETDLVGARKAGQMEVVYQPVVDLQTGVVSGVEALLRWDHPQLGAISPDLFIPIAEENGVILDLGAWVLEQACREAASWERKLTIAVNVSAKQILREDFVPLILDTLAQTKLEPSRLELELTESILVQDADAALRAIRSLRKLGVSVALDDFGTGYSSLSYLRDFAFDKIKIDKSFIANLGELDSTEPQGATTLVTAIVNLAKTLGMRTTAEGIELESQADDLRDMGCNIGQGYLFARPVKARDLRAIIGMKEVKDVSQRSA